MTHWIRFKQEGRLGFGAAMQDEIVEYEGDLFSTAAPTGKRIASNTVQLLSPCMPSKIIALWNNYHALGAKLGKVAPAHPLFLIKPASCVAGPGDFIRRPATYQGKIAFEGELGIVIGKHCSDVPIGEAAQYIFGYTCVNDVTARELLNEDANFPQWCRSKGYDSFGCIGPVIATDFDWSNGRVVTRMDGVERQNYPLSDMIFSPEEQVSRLSYDMSLLPGDVIACGTSIGIGSIKDGAVVEICIEGIGSLTNTLAL